MFTVKQLKNVYFTQSCQQRDTVVWRAIQRLPFGLVVPWQSVGHAYRICHRLQVLDGHQQQMIMSESATVAVTRVHATNSCTRYAGWFDSCVAIVFSIHCVPLRMARTYFESFMSMVFAAATAAAVVPAAAAAGDAISFFWSHSLLLDSNSFRCAKKCRIFFVLRSDSLLRSLIAIKWCELVFGKWINLSFYTD